MPWSHDGGQRHQAKSTSSGSDAVCMSAVQPAGSGKRGGVTPVPPGGRAVMRRGSVAAHKAQATEPLLWRQDLPSLTRYRPQLCADGNGKGHAKERGGPHRTGCPPGSHSG
eukprot:2723671-Amphidinium_carterae.1